MRGRFSIVKRRKWFFLLSGLITVAGVVVLMWHGFRLGPDFTAGSRIQIQGQVARSVAEGFMQRAGVNPNDEQITYGGSPSHKLTIIRLPRALTNAQERAVTRNFTPRAAIHTVDPLEAKILAHKAIVAVLLASLFILAYVGIRFEYRFAVAAILALLHDVLVVMAVFALFRIEVNLLFVTAILTIVGYSINDTIVIFDRIRENIKIKKPENRSQLEELTDDSLWQTMRRSINTVATVLIATVTLLFFGGPTIHNFTLALTVGLVSGAYSSVFIASPLWVWWRSRGYEPGPAVLHGENEMR